MPSTGNIPLSTAIAGELISSSLWNTEFQNINNLMTPAGIDTYSATDAQMQIQTNPYPGSVTSHATALAGELERLRYMISQLSGKPYWYQTPDASVATIFDSILPVGAVIDYPSSTAPNSNFHLADGTAINRALYPTLFSLIGTTFGVGDGSTTFNLPDYRDRMSIGAGNLYALAATGGAVSHTLAKNQIPSGLLTLNDPGHTHSINDTGHTHGVTDPTHSHVEQYKVTGNTGNTIGATTNQGNGSSTATNSPSTQASSTGVTVNSATTGITGTQSNTTGISLTDNGGSTPVNLLNPYLSMYKMIRVI